MAQNSVADNAKLLKESEDNTVDEKVVRVDKEPRIDFLFFLTNLSDQLCHNHEGEFKLKCIQHLQNHLFRA